jgi:uncharacterized protein DUF3551
MSALGLSRHFAVQSSCPLYPKSGYCRYNSRANELTWLDKRQSTPMRLSIWTGCLLTATSLLVTTTSADPYRWCAINNVGGGTNCGFVTIEQCRASITGVGGFCEPKQTVPSGLSPAAKAAAPKTDASGGKDKLMECVTDSCKINCSPNVKKRFRPKWCVHFKEPVV